MSQPAPQFVFHVEIRDKSGNVKDILQRDISSIHWSYDVLGGCGEAQIVLKREFDNYGDIDLEYDVRIRRVPTPLIKPGDRLPAQFVSGQPGILLAGGDVTGKPELRWRGLVRRIVPVLDRTETVTLMCSGYQRQLESINVPAQTYSSQDVAAAARSIIDTYVVPGSQIKRTDSLGLVPNSGVNLSATGPKFTSSAYEALRTLAEIGGNLEWGVRPGLNPAALEDNEIYFLARSSTVKQTWHIGDRVKYFTPEKNLDKIVREVFLLGAAGFTATVTSPLGNEAGYHKKRTIALAGIRHASDATLWGTAFFSRFESAQDEGQLILSATDKWIENDPLNTGQAMPPIGKLRVQGGPVFVRAGAKLPAQFGASGIQLTAHTIGGTTFKEFRPVRIFYRPMGGALQIEIELGEKGSALEDYLKGLEYKLSQAVQAM